VILISSIFGTAEQEGQCGDVCANLCEHQPCFPDFVSSSPDLCTCINDAVSNCGSNARCDEPSETCVCNEGFAGDPLVGCNPPTEDPFNILLAFNDNVLDNIRNIVTEQAQTWEGVITAGLPAETGVLGTIDPCAGIDGAEPCPCPATPETIDDMYMCMAFVQLAPNILGSANFELLREGNRGSPTPEL